MDTHRSCSGLRCGLLAAFSCLALLLAGCGGSSNEDPKDDAAEDIDLVAPIPTDTSARADSLVQHLVVRYLSYAYQGASLRSGHPLNDSLFALKAEKGAGGPVLLVDTFDVRGHSISPEDSSHTVQVHAPHALRISNVWTSSNPEMGHAFTVRIEDRKIAGAPRIVGWPALRDHILRVEPDSGEAIVTRLEERWTDLIDEQPSV